MTATDRTPEPGRIHVPVCIVEDDPYMRAEIAETVRTIADDVRSFRSAGEFLQAAPEIRPAVLLLDLMLPGISGVELLGRIREDGHAHAVAVLSANESVATAIDTIRLGVDDYIIKPVSRRRLLEAVRSLAHIAEAVHGVADCTAAEALVRRLSLRERAVLLSLMQGLQNKEIAARLGISTRTVEMHRANMMTKLRVRTSGEAVHVAIRGGLACPREAAEPPQVHGPAQQSQCSGGEAKVQTRDEVL